MKMNYPTASSGVSKETFLSTTPRGGKLNPCPPLVGLKYFIIYIIILLIAVVGCDKNKDYFVNPSKSDGNTNSTEIPDSIKVVYAGVRSSSYGIHPFPSPSGWQNAMETMSGYFEGSTPCAIWIVGEIWGSECHLFFPSDGNDYPNISFDSNDKHESYLDHFDNVGIKVFLQVEPADADINTLIDLVFNRYGHHECVIGFGIDVEWYDPNNEGGINGEDFTERVTNELAEEWETQVKSHNDNYKLFLKHWDRRWMPPTYRSEIVFVDDSQIFPNASAFLDEFTKYWADYFNPNMVFFQIGYESDKHWWQAYDNPPKDLGTLLSENIDQQCGFFWVDFTLRDVLPTDNVTVSRTMIPN